MFKFFFVYKYLIYLLSNMDLVFVSGMLAMQ